MCPRVPEGILRSDHDVPRQVPDVRQEIQHTVQIASAQVVVLQRAVEREGSAVRRNGLHGPFFPLVDGVDPAASGDFAFLDVPGIRQHEPVADLPPGDRRRQRQRGVARARLGREAQKRRRLHAAVHGHFSEDVDPRPELIRVGDTAAERRISDDDLGSHIGSDRGGSGAHFQDAAGAHPHIAGHDLEVRHLQAGIDGGTRRRACRRPQLCTRPRTCHRW